MFGWLKKDEQVIVEEPIVEETFSAIPVIEEEPVKKVVKERKNPGKFEDLNREAKEVNGNHDAFDGLRCDLSKSYGDRFQISHSIGLGSSAEPANYSFSASWVGGIERIPNKQPVPRSIIHTRLGSDGSLTGRFFQHVGPNFLLKFTGQTGAEPHNSGLSVEAEYEGSDWHGQFKWVNPGTYGFAYHQFITQRISLGCDIFYKYQPGVCAGNYGIRYNGDKSVSTLIANPNTIAASFTRMVSDKVSLSTEWVAAPTKEGTIETQYTLGLEYKLRMSMFKARFDSSGKVFGHLEEAVNPATKFLLSAELDHKKKQYKFGMGLSLNI